MNKPSYKEEKSEKLVTVLASIAIAAVMALLLQIVDETYPDPCRGLRNHQVPPPHSQQLGCPN